MFSSFRTQELQAQQHLQLHLLELNLFMREVSLNLFAKVKKRNNFISSSSFKLKSNLKSLELREELIAVKPLWGEDVR